MSNRISKKDIEESKIELRKLINPGDTIYTMIKHVSRSGMYRVIDLYVMKNNKPYRISGIASDLLEGYDMRHEGCKASGCGMDMGFHLVYNLSYTLYPDYDCLITDKSGDWYKCPSPDHVNHGDCQNNKQHHDGYALLQQWL